MNDRQWAFSEIERLQAENASLTAILAKVHELADRDMDELQESYSVILGLIFMLTENHNIQESIGH